MYEKREYILYFLVFLGVIDYIIEELSWQPIYYCLELSNFNKNMVNSGCKKSEEEMDSFPKRGKKEANKPYFKTPKEEFTNSISADLDELVININDEDTTKTLDETSVMKNQKQI